MESFNILGAQNGEIRVLNLNRFKIQWNKNVRWWGEISFLG